MSGELYSHPNLHLAEHIRQVGQAVQSLRQWHSNQVWQELEGLVPWMVRLHDLGKASLAFQEYIRDPQGYKGTPLGKSHTPLSLVLTLTLASLRKWDVLDSLSLAMVVRGHHSGLPTLPARKIGAVNSAEQDLDSFAGGEIVRVLRNQLSSLPVADLVHAAGIEDLKHFQIPEEARLGTFIRQTQRFLHRLIETFARLSEQEAIRFRIKTQLLFSILLEADKAFLALTDPERYVQRIRHTWDPVWIEKRIASPVASETNRLRRQIREEMESSLAEQGNTSIFSLTAPTGCGKTLLAATWAFKLREQLGANEWPPKIIVVLPFLSVIDQTANEYTKLLEIGGVEKDGSWLMTSHSLAPREYDNNLEEEEQRFFIDTWRSELIITTYDQFLLTMMDPRTRYQMRFHNLCDALIIMDEVQSLPCHLWQPLDKLLNGLAVFGNTKILLMSATMPSFVSGQIALLRKYSQYFRAFARYELLLRISFPQNIDEFCSELQERIEDWLREGARVLITLNTRGSARKVWNALQEVWPEEYGEVPLFFISADVTPKDRLKFVKKIKEGKPCIVVSTQSIEAGVDIDMDIVIRDFAPLDSIIQVAGRCNREGLKPRGRVEVVDLINENAKRYSELIYDQVHLQVTRELLEDLDTVQEEDVLSYTERYFQELSKRKNTGAQHLEKLLRWQEGVSVHELLRGKEKLQFTFLVIEQDPGLMDDMEKVRGIKDRWERREAWRRLAARIAMISVSVLARPGFHPRQIANEYMNDLWILRPGYYSEKCGLAVEGDTMIF